jgi:hypothetical protein
VLDAASSCVGTIQVDDVKLDAARGDAVLCKKARRIVGHIAYALSTVPRRDIYSAPPVDPAGGFTVTDQAYQDWPALAGSKNR